MGGKNFYDIFALLEPCEEFEKAQIKHIHADSAMTEMKICLFFEGEAIPRRSIAGLEKQISRAYSADSVKIYASCGFGDAYLQSLFSDMDFLIPTSVGFLDGADAELCENKVVITVKNGVSDIVEGIGREIAQIILSETGTAADVVIKECSESEARKISEEFEKTRIEQMNKLAECANWTDQHEKKPSAAANKGGKISGAKTYNRRAAAKAVNPENSDDIIMGKPTAEPPVKIEDISMESGNVTVCGDVFFTDMREIPAKNLTVVIFEITDYTGSIRVSRVMDSEKALPIIESIKPGMHLQVQGTAGYSKFEKDTIITPTSILKREKTVKKDLSEQKRVELHLHTNMSTMDGISTASDYIKRAAEWGHKAIAITDHGVVQAFPEAMSAGKKHGIKIIYGVEGYLVNDLGVNYAVNGGCCREITDETVVFDLETTGLRAERDAITEIAAVIVKNGEIGERFHSYVNPNRPIPAEITKLTGISDATVKDAPQLCDILPEFLKFIAGRPMCAHNASFDMGFLRAACKNCGIEQEFVSIDTLPIARALLPNLGRHKLNIIAEALNVGDFDHHRADEDTLTLAKIYIKFIERLKAEHNVKTVDDINTAISQIKGSADNMKSRHIILLVKNQTGLQNLYKLISDSHLKHFKKRPLIHASLLSEHREGILLGSACEAGELFTAVLAGAPMPQLLKTAQFYDFMEIQPIGNNAFLLQNGTVQSEEALRDLNRKIVEIADKLKKPVVATGDVHFLNPEDEAYRRILMAGMGFSDADRQAPLYFKTTDQMLDEFSYLGERRAREVVIDNPNMIADMCDPITPIPISDKPFSPELPGSKEELVELTYGKAKRLYGDELPSIVKNRIEKELRPITKYGFDVMYMIAQKLVAKSLECGYLVGSRGSVGSSIVAFMSGITEVNALAPHYRCPECKYSEFFTNGEYGCGADMEDKACPKCGTSMDKDGFDIPFETFLGFDADKAPDIDLNFSGEYQARAHKHTIELFGEDHVFRAGTIGTVAEKTAYGFVRKYMEERGINAGKAEINRLTVGCTGVKRTTGQHPGGLIVVPKNLSILQFTPVQRPADDVNSDIITTHFDYHSIHDLLLKLDLLAHDNPTMIRMLEDLTGEDATKIPLDDKDTMSIFTGTKALGFEDDPVLGKIGAAAIPEFGTKFVREMLKDTQPTTFDELVRISGLSHGTNVWVGNAQDLVRSGVTTLKHAICARDDIMLYLISMQLDPKESFFIMESVRKGKGLKPEWEDDMRAHAVPEWYIESCKKIKYMFPKAHAVAYVMMAFRIAWFKVHYPLEFYCAYFSGRISSFDAVSAARGKDFIKSKLKEGENNPNLTAAEKENLVTLEICYEFCLRGLKFENVDIYKSHPTKFVMTEDSLIPPLTAVAGLGETAAQSIADERENGKFLSVDELSIRCSKVSKAICEKLKECGALGDIPQSAQISLFAD